MKKNRIKPALHVLKNYEKRKSLTRFIRIDYPIYKLPVKLTERMSEPYESLEWFMMQFLVEGKIVTKRELSVRLGIHYESNILIETLLHLEFIGHILIKGEQISVTPIGKESCQKREKIYEAETRRLLYFDALSLEALPREYYDDTSFRTMNVNDRDILHHSYVFDLWSGFPNNHLKRLLELDGEARYQRNLPQEMQSIEIQFELLEQDDDFSLEGMIEFCPLYVALCEQAGVETISEVYTATNGKQSKFFNRLLKANIMTMTELIKVNDIAAIQDEWSSFKTEGVPVTQWIDVTRFKLSQSQKVSYTITMADIEKWRRDDNVTKRIVRHLAFIDHLPLEHKKWPGMLLHLRCDEAEVAAALWKIIKQQNSNYFDGNDYSKEYISKKNAELYERFDQTFNGA